MLMELPQAAPAGYHLRRMQLQDVPDVLAQERLLYEFPWSKENFTSSINSGYECWLLLWDNAPAGYVVLSTGAGEAHLLNISVVSTHQNKGLGRWLLRFIVERADALKTSVVFLEVRVSNLKAQGLYQSEGFNEIGLRKGYYPASKSREDAMVLALELLKEM